MDVVKLLPLQGAWLLAVYPGRCPGLGASALSGRVGPSFGIPDTTKGSICYALLLSFTKIIFLNDNSKCLSNN